MTWTYAGTPGTSTAAERRDAVRLLIGDTDTTGQQVTDEEIAFALVQGDDDIYTAAAEMCRAIAAKYSRLVDTSVESVRTSYSQRQAHYTAMAARLDRQAKTLGTKGLGTPEAGGISIAAIETADDDTDRPTPAFRDNQWNNPPGTDPYKYEWPE